jgi:hypothetical protein
MQFCCGGSEMHAFTAGVRADADNLFVVTDEPSHVDVWRGIAFSTPFSAALLLPGTPPPGPGADGGNLPRFLD